jgi:Protein of unknown function (DUF2958)
MNWMDLIEPNKLDDLISNHREQQKVKGTRSERDFEPVVKLFVPWSSGTWLLSECAPDGLAFGLCDMGFGTPELGYVSLDEVAALRGPGGLHVEQDFHFKANKTLSRYADEARQQGRIRA